MSQAEIIERAIDKAIDGGWDVFSTENHQIEVFEVSYENLEDEDHYYSDAPHPGVFVDVRRNGYYSPNELIFNHDFAKALWGEDEHDADVGTYDVEWNRCTKCDGNDFLVDYCYQYHLMLMVIAPDPIQYLAENI